MKFKFFAIVSCALGLAACGDNTPNPDALKGANFVSEQPGTNITLSFDPVDMRVYGGVVNRYSGEYQADGNTIKFGPFVSTMMMDEPAAMETEQIYFQFMPTVEKYELADGKLTLIGANDTEIVFTQIDSTPDDAPSPQNAE